MKKLLLLASAVLLASPASAEWSQRENDIYEYGFEWGWLSHSCMLLQEGYISAKTFSQDVRIIDQEPELPRATKDRVFSNIREGEKHERCIEALDAYQNRNSKVQPAKYEL